MYPFPAALMTRRRRTGEFSFPARAGHLLLVESAGEGKLLPVLKLKEMGIDAGRNVADHQGRT
jgi:hypothetical protein